MNKDKIRRQILETPYKLQDICPTRKLKAPEDVLRRIQKKIAYAEKKRARSLAENNEAHSLQNKTTSLSKRHLRETSPLTLAESQEGETREWIDEFRRRYKSFGDNKNGGLQREWYTATDIFQQVANAYSNKT